VQIEAVPEPRHPPVLQLGLVGFSHRQQTEIEATLRATESSDVAWRVGPLQEAAAWWINGARTQMLTDGSIRVASGDADGRWVRLSLAEVDRPVAFAEPVICKSLEPAITFTPTEAGCVTALRNLESRWLQETVARHWLCARLIARQRSLPHRVFHVIGDGDLLAVIDPAGDVGIARGARVSDLETARWVALPSSANFIPKDFQRISWSELIWSYAVQSCTDHLPARYRSKAIYFRRPPKVAQRLLRDQHLVLMAELRAGPTSFDALLARSGFSDSALSKRLGELYLAGSITVTPGRANDAHRPPVPRRAWRETARERSWTPFGDSRHSGSVIDTGRLDPTVPAVLHMG
jgi:hypothetical protein